MRPFAAGREIVPSVEVVAHLARSRRQDVYDAWDHERACRVAVKVLRPDRRGDAGATRDLLREGRLLRRVAHPHLVRAFAVHREPLAAVVLETLGGETLEHLVETADEPLAAEELRVVGRQLAAAVHHLHRHGVLHLDLKPANVIADRVRSGHGTWCYAAPEQARGGQVGPATDVWGIALVLHALATGTHVLIERADTLDVDEPQLHGPLPSIREARPDLPEDLAALIDASLAGDPGDRPGIAAWLGGRPGA